MNYSPISLYQYQLFNKQSNDAKLITKKTTATTIVITTRTKITVPYKMKVEGAYNLELDGQTRAPLINALGPEIT